MRMAGFGTPTLQRGRNLLHRTFEQKTQSSGAALCDVRRDGDYCINHFLAQEGFSSGFQLFKNHRGHFFRGHYQLLLASHNVDVRLPILVHDFERKVRNVFLDLLLLEVPTNQTLGIVHLNE